MLGIELGLEYLTVIRIKSYFLPADMWSYKHAAGEI